MIPVSVSSSASFSPSFRRTLFDGLRTPSGPSEVEVEVVVEFVVEVAVEFEVEIVVAAVEVAGEDDAERSTESQQMSIAAVKAEVDEEREVR